MSHDVWSDYAYITIHLIYFNILQLTQNHSTAQRRQNASLNSPVSNTLQLVEKLTHRRHLLPVPLTNAPLDPPHQLKQEDFHLQQHKPLT